MSGSLSSAEVDGAVDPIISALEALRRALATNEDSLNIVDHSKEDWDHLKLVSGIMDQRQKLSGIVASFSSSAGEFLVSLFASILRHKALTDSSKQNSIIVRKFSFSTAQFEVFVCSGRVPSSLSIENRMSIMRTKNQVLSSQRCFQESLVSFLPVYEHTVHLNPVLRFRIIKSYIDAVQQFLYGPLLRQLFKEMSSVVSVQNTVCFASLPRTKARRLGTKTVPLQRFHEVGALSSSSALGVKGGGLNSQGATAFHIWDSMLLAILLVSPVIDREKAFFEVRITIHIQT